MRRTGRAPFTTLHYIKKRRDAVVGGEIQAIIDGAACPTNPGH